MQRIEIQVVAVVFIENKYILPEDMTEAADEYFFTYLPVAKREKYATEKVVSSIYKDNL